MTKGRKGKSRARHPGPAQLIVKRTIGGVWVDFHNTLVERKTGVVKECAERALKRKISMSPDAVDLLVESARLRLEDRMGPRAAFVGPNWEEINKAAFAEFGCTSEQAKLMSQLVTESGNYVPTEERVGFVRWILERFPTNSAENRYTITASNAEFGQVKRFLDEHELEQITPVTGEMLDLYKPRPEFFERLIAFTRVAAEQTLFVANSWRNDAVASFLGVNVIVLMPPSVTLSNREIMRRIRKAGKPKGRIFLARNIPMAKEIIAAHFKRAA